MDILNEPPPNPAGGDTLIVDASDPSAFERPSAALKHAKPEDQIFIRPGVYEDKIVIVDRPVLLIGAGRDVVQIFSRRGGPLLIQSGPGGALTGFTFPSLGRAHNP